MRAALERRKCADCPASTTRVYCRFCVRRHSRSPGTATGPKTVAKTLFSGSPEANARRRTLLDAIDLVPLIDHEGWINFLPWAERCGYEVPTTQAASGLRATRAAMPTCSAARQWERLKQRLRSQGLEVEARAATDYSSNNGGQRDAPEDAFSRTSMRLTVDGWDRLRALTKALDDWLCSVQEVA